MLLYQLKSFYLAVKYNNISKAARVLNMSQSAITHQLKALEETVGSKLYERNPRGITPTPIGKALMKHSHEILQKVNEMHDELSYLKDLEAKIVTIVCHRGICTYVLPEVIQKFRALYPQCLLEIRNRFVDTVILELVANGEVDLGIATNWNDFKEFGLDFLPFVNHDIVLCMAKDYCFKGVDIDHYNVTLETIAAEPLLLYESQTAISKRIKEIFKENNLDIKVVLTMGGAANLLKYARIGLGLALISSLCIKDENTDNIKIIPVSHLFGSLAYGIVLRKNRFLTKTLTDFITILSPDLIINGDLTALDRY
ncbi:LysR family transcriptional regulator [candidate division CSSED10-310 bacterium]|uniref:LysR family transcriptional regulator n=1 Tax=candidate division CSSED10-310 bacterium TaxID=2855610 RepID=A0ABV6YSM3_UNCC1